MLTCDPPYNDGQEETKDPSQVEHIAEAMEVIFRGTQLPEEIETREAGAQLMTQQRCPKCLKSLFQIFFSEGLGFYYRCLFCGKSDALEFVENSPPKLKYVTDYEVRRRVTE